MSCNISRSSRRYMKRRGLALKSGRVDKPYPSVSPDTFPAVTQPVAAELVSIEAELKLQRYDNPDQGTAPTT